MKTKNNIQRLGLLAVLCLLTAVSALAQTFTLSGTVKDDTGEGAIGATVKVEGTQNGTVTDLDGNFQLQNVKVGDKIAISYVGYMAETIDVASQAPVNITLKPDTEMLDEVVVVGYGATKKSSISGSVSTVKADDLPKAATGSLGEMLRGKAAGMNITSNSASPGSSMNISIRGGLSGQNPSSSSTVCHRWLPIPCRRALAIAAATRTTDSST